MKSELSSILGKLPEIKKALGEIKAQILTDLIMISQIPSPTFDEEERRRYLVERFTESSLLNCSVDEVGNGMGILPGEKGDKNILIVSHLDSIFDKKVDHNCTVNPDRIYAPGISDNALGVAIVASLPDILEHLGIKLDSNLILMGTSSSLGEGDIGGLRFFLKNSKMEFCSGLCVEGVKLGRLSYTSIGMRRCELKFTIPHKYDWTRFGAAGPIIAINETINRIMEIPMPRRPRSSIVFNAINGGNTSNRVPTRAGMHFEIRSESEQIADDLTDKIQDITQQISADTGEKVSFKVISRTNPGGIGFSHPLAVTAREIMESLGVTPRITPSTSDLAAFIQAGIPALTIGLTNGDDLGLLEESIEIEPIFTGLAQLLGIILAVDRRLCNES